MKQYLANFNDLLLRNDVGQLWENYIISEGIKLQHYQGWASNNYFWRTYDQQEIDWIEERDGGLFAFEMKYKNHPVKVPGGWAKNYPEGSFIGVSGYQLYLQKAYIKGITQYSFHAVMALIPFRGIDHCPQLQVCQTDGQFHHGHVDGLSLHATAI